MCSQAKAGNVFKGKGRSRWVPTSAGTWTTNDDVRSSSSSVSIAMLSLCGYGYVDWSLPYPRPSHPRALHVDRCALLSYLPHLHGHGPGWVPGSVRVCRANPALRIPSFREPVHGPPAATAATAKVVQPHTPQHVRNTRSKYVHAGCASCRQSHG